VSIIVDTLGGMASNAALFEADPDWTAYASKKGYLPDTSIEPAPIKFNIAAGRAQQLVEEGEWSKKHPLSSVGYASVSSTIPVRDGHGVNVKVSYPITWKSRASGTQKLPILFVTHGGGWLKGTHTT
jgi:acetyl esterase